MKNEIWKPIENVKDYQISNYGRIKSFKNSKERILKQRYDSHGYPRVNLRIFDKNITKRIHRIVAETFIPNPNLYPFVNHKDNNPKNNHIDNLEWCTERHNTIHFYNSRITYNYNDKTYKYLISKSVSENLTIKEVLDNIIMFYINHNESILDMRGI